MTEFASGNVSPLLARRLGFLLCQQLSRTGEDLLLFYLPSFPLLLTHCLIARKRVERDIV